MFKFKQLGFNVNLMLIFFSEVSLWWGWWWGGRRETWGDWGVSLHTLWPIHDEAGRLQTQNAGQLGWGGIGSEVH